MGYMEAYSIIRFPSREEGVKGEGSVSAELAGLIFFAKIGTAAQRQMRKQQQYSVQEGHTQARAVQHLGLGKTVAQL
jgi:hypothetical protein